MPLDSKINKIITSTILSLLTSCAQYNMPPTVKAYYLSLTENNDIIAPSKLDIKRDITEANRILINFPRKISNAYVKKFLVPEARYCLVHIKAIHPLNIEELNLVLNTNKEDWPSKPERKKIIQKHVELVNNTQKEIYDILSYLVEDYQISAIRYEGLTPSTIEDNSDFYTKLYSDRLKELKDIDLISFEEYNRFMQYTILKYFIKEQPEIYLTKEPEKFSRYEFYPGAAFLLALEKKIRLLPSETLDSLLSGNHFKRENDLINSVIFHKESLVVAVWGAAHCLQEYTHLTNSYYYPNGDNLYLWNKKNPDKRISLIEITPKSLDAISQWFKSLQ